MSVLPWLLSGGEVPARHPVARHAPAVVAARASMSAVPPAPEHRPIPRMRPAAAFRSFAIVIAGRKYGIWTTEYFALRRWRCRSDDGQAAWFFASALAKMGRS